MILYMVRDKKTGLYYKRGSGWKNDNWVAQKEASIWTTPGGPRGALGNITKWNERIKRVSTPQQVKTRDPEIVTLEAHLLIQVTFVDGDN